MNILTLKLTRVVVIASLSGVTLSACGGGGEVPATATSPSGPGSKQTIPIGAAITEISIDNTSTAAQTDVPVTFGQVFAEGDLSPLDSVAGKLNDGSAFPVQVDVKATHPDGSLRHAVVSAVLPSLTSNQTQRIQLTKAVKDSSSNADGTPADLVSAGFTASVNITVGGQSYTASADALLKAGKYTTWLAGPVVNEWLVSAPLKTTGGVEHPHLTARFAIRSYTGINKAKVDVIIENAWAYEPGPQNFTYDAQVVVGGQTVYSKAGLTHYHHARWRKSFWWGTAPQTHVAHNTAYLIASKAVPNYDQSIKFTSASVSGFKAAFTGAKTEPMGTGVAMAEMPTTGGRADIGLLPGWAAMYLLSMDKDARNITLGTADLSGSWSSHYRDKNTGRPISVVNYPYMTLLGQSGDTFNPVTKKYESFPACGGVCTNPNVADSAHQPSFNYLPYLLTGDHYYLEELQFWAMWNALKSNPGYRGAEKGLLNSDQIRGQAWAMRTLAHAAYITPDADPLKAQFETFLSTNLDWYNENVTNNPNANKLGALITSNGFIEYNGGLGIAPWQDDFFTSAVGHIAELGYSKAQPLLQWKAKFPVSRMTGPGFCWILGAGYAMNVRATTSGPLYTTIADVYKGTWPSTLTSLACAGTEMASNLQLKVGEMTGYSDNWSGFPSNMQPALAYSATSGAAGGANAWNVFMGRSVKPDYSLAPEFAVVPR